MIRSELRRRLAHAVTLAIAGGFLFLLVRPALGDHGLIGVLAVAIAAAFSPAPHL